MIKVAIVGYGNVGKAVFEAIYTASDFELIGVVRRKTSYIPSELINTKIVEDIKDLESVDVAIICKDTRSVPKYAKQCLELGINTVDSYDTHNSIYDLKMELDTYAKKSGAKAIISAGWDPGSDSIIRALLEAIAPKGLTYTNFGPGMSMGHTVAVKAIEGVKNALSITIPIGTGIHRRMVYIELEDGYDFDKVSVEIKNDPYFSHDETYVKLVTDVDSLADMGHGVNLIRKGVSGITCNQLFEFNMKINNPALTGQIMVAMARATLKQAPGAYTAIEIPLIDMIYGDREDIIRRLV